MKDRFWIDHPATQGGPVGLRRWFKYHVGTRLAALGSRWEDEALHPHRCRVCGAAIPEGVNPAECDICLPF